LVDTTTVAPATGLLARVEHQPLEPEGADRVVVDEDLRLAAALGAGALAAVGAGPGRSAAGASAGADRRLGGGLVVGLAQREEPHGDQRDEDGGDRGEQAGLHRRAL
jgi:hypothetical protein